MVDHCNSWSSPTSSRPRNGTSHRLFTPLPSRAYYELPRHGFNAPPDPWILENPDSRPRCSPWLAFYCKLGSFYQHNSLERPHQRCSCIGIYSWFVRLIPSQNLRFMRTISVSILLRAWKCGFWTSSACFAHFTWQRLQPFPARRLYDSVSLHDGSLVSLRNLKLNIF